MTAKQAQHLGVYGVIHRLGQILLVKKTRGPYTGKWDLPGGKLQHGETIFEALSRELKEEVNLSIDEKEVRFWANLTALTEDKEHSFFHIGLLYEIVQFDPQMISHNIVREDVGGAAWLSLDAFNKNELTPFARDAINKLS